MSSVFGNFHADLLEQHRPTDLFLSFKILFTLQGKVYFSHGELLSLTTSTIYLTLHHMLLCDICVMLFNSLYVFVMFPPLDCKCIHSSLFLIVQHLLCMRHHSLCWKNTKKQKNGLIARLQEFTI